MRKLIYSTAGALILGLCFISGASAGPIGGSYTYSLTGETSTPACQITYGGNPWTDNFASTSGGNSIASDQVTFSICDGTTGFLDDGTFSIVNGVNALTGTFSGVLSGTTPSDDDVFVGTILVTSATGYYSSVTIDTGTFLVITGQVGSPQFPTGTFQFDSTPEPATVVFAGSGLLLLGLFRKSLKRQA